jgi:nicotinate (nicotinamide) nucleotide adenylyltransferase
MPHRLAILAGSFNPPTRAHLALAKAALTHADEVLFVLPKVFPHKEYVGASLDQRIGMLRTATAGNPNWAIGIADRGLFIEIAAEAKPHFPHSEFWFVCGRDAAERIVAWDYGHPSAFTGMLDVFGLLVARRQGAYTPPPELAERIKPLAFESYDEHSSTEVRERIKRGGEWRHLVPASIANEVEQIYS